MGVGACGRGDGRDGVPRSLCYCYYSRRLGIVGWLVGRHPLFASPVTCSWLVMSMMMIMFVGACAYIHLSVFSVPGVRYGWAVAGLGSLTIVTHGYRIMTAQSPIMNTLPGTSL